MARKIKKKNIIIMVLIFMTTHLKSVNADNINSITNFGSNIDNTVTNLNSILIVLLIILGIFIFILIVKLSTTKKDLNEIPTELTDKDIEKIDNNLNIEILKEETFSLYKKLETAKTKQNIKNLKEILTDDLYLEQEQKIKNLKENHQKVVATNIKLENFKVLSITNLNDIQTILTYLHVSQYDYITDKKKAVIRGTSDSVYQIEYKITLEKNSDKQYRIKKKECVGKWIKN